MTWPLRGLGGLSLRDLVSGDLPQKVRTDKANFLYMECAVKNTRLNLDVTKLHYKMAELDTN